MEERQTQRHGRREFDVSTEVFIGAMLTIMGVLVLITPVVSEMPTDHPVDPTLLDVVIGVLYIAIGAFVFDRARRKVARARAARPSAAAQPVGDQQGGPHE